MLSRLEIALQPTLSRPIKRTKQVIYFSPSDIQLILAPSTTSATPDSGDKAALETPPTYRSVAIYTADVAVGTENDDQYDDQPRFVWIPKGH